MARRLKIAVLRDRYQTKFMTPKASRHSVKAVYFLPANKISYRIEGLTLIAPSGADLGHFHNRIPAISGIPYVMSFESHLPRYFGGEQTGLFKFMRKQLAKPQCRRLLAMSQFAERIFLRQHADTPEFASLRDKLEVVYPNIALPEPRLTPRKNPLPLKLVFIGAHFGRKGGAVASRAAAIARIRGLPIHFYIISTLNAGSGVWSDPQQDNFFEPYFRLLDAENITFKRRLPNTHAIDMLRESDFLILATFSDTFGFSALEALSVGTPVITTPQGALPEFVTPQKNGIMLGLDVNEMGEWIHIDRSDKGSAHYARIFRDEIERLANELINTVASYVDKPENLLPLRNGARDTAENMFNAATKSSYLDDLYEQCVTETKPLKAVYPLN